MCPDISMCQNQTCSKRMTCYRFRAIPNEFRQSYGMFKPNKEGECEYYSHIDPEEQFNITKED